VACIVAMLEGRSRLGQVSNPMTWREKFTIEKGAPMHGAVNARPLHRVRAAAAMFILIAVAACTTRLAPAYDQTIVDGLASVNKDTQTLFAAIGSEATKESFPSRKDSYDHIVGSLNALVIQAKARPSPDVSLADANAALAKAGIPANCQ
jgi:hypothetical protein